MTDDDRALLEFEGRFWHHAGAKDDAVLTTFGLSRWQYRQKIFDLCAKPEALAEFPILVNRVNRGRRRTG